MFSRRLLGIAFGAGLLIAVGAPAAGSCRGSRRSAARGWGRTTSAAPTAPQLACPAASRRSWCSDRATPALRPSPVSFRAGTLRFEVPGRPPVTFRGTLRNDVLAGVVDQARRARNLPPPARAGAGSLRTRALRRRRSCPCGGRRSLWPERLVDLDSGKVHALYPRRQGFAIGAGFRLAGTDDRNGDPRCLGRGSSAPCDCHGFGLVSPRFGFGSGSALLAGTLTVPPGPGPHAAVRSVEGSGETVRAYLPDLHPRAPAPARGSGARLRSAASDSRAGVTRASRRLLRPSTCWPETPQRRCSFLADQTGIDPTPCGHRRSQSGGLDRAPRGFA